MKWFIDKVEKKTCTVYNPFNYYKYNVSLDPNNIDVLVMWSKNFSLIMPFMPYLKDKFNLYMFYTITGLSGILEKNVPDKEYTIKNFKELSTALSGEQVQWRFDPIIITPKTDFQFYLKNFEYIASLLEGYTKRCYISFANIYPKVKRNLIKNNITIYEESIEERKDFAVKLSEIAESKGMQLFACWDDNLPNERIKKANCVDIKIFNQIFNLELKNNKAPSRKGCGCYKSIDIGVYNTCLNNCVYCYANINLKAAKKNYEAHSFDNNFLLE